MVRALAERMRTAPPAAPSLTWDRGSELAAHRAFTVATDVQVYFCDPAQSVAARLERKYQWAAPPVLSEGHRPRGVQPSQLDAIARASNTRPRKTLGYQTPAARLAETVASTG